MIEKLQGIEVRYMEIEEKLSSSEVMSDMELYKKFSKEYKSLTEIVEVFRAYKQAKKNISDAEEILASEQDAEMRELAKAEIQESIDFCSEAEQKLKELLLPKDPNDDKNVIIEI